MIVRSLLFAAAALAVMPMSAAAAVGGPVLPVLGDASSYWGQVFYDAFADPSVIYDRSFGSGPGPQSLKSAFGTLGSEAVYDPEPAVSAFGHLGGRHGADTGYHAASETLTFYNIAFTAADDDAYAILLAYLDEIRVPSGLANGMTITGRGAVTASVPDYPDATLERPTFARAKAWISGEPISFSDTLFVECNGFDGGSASYIYSDFNNVTTTSADASFDDPAATCGAFHYSTVGALFAGDPASLSVFGQIAINASVEFYQVGDAFAWIDPSVALGSGFTGDRSRYILSVSPNLGALPSAAVPEPAGWALLIGGFGLTGVALRRRRGLHSA